MAIEKPILKLRPSRIGFLKDYLLALFLALFLIYLNLINFYIIWLGYAAAVILILILIASPEIQKIRNVYKITPSQVIVEEGIIGRKRKSVFMDNIADVSVQQNILERLVGFGTVVIGSSSGREHMELKLSAIKRPKKVAYEIERAIKSYSKQKSS